MVLKGVVV